MNTMNAGGSKTRKKTSPKTPGKGQRTLSSFFTNSSKRSSSSTENLESRNDSYSKFSKGHSGSTDYDEQPAKKRKLSSGNRATSVDHLPKPKTVSICNPDTKVMTNPVRFRDRMKHNTVDSEEIIIVEDNKCENQESRRKRNADCLSASCNILPSKTDNFTDSQRANTTRIKSENDIDANLHEIIDIKENSSPLKSKHCETSPNAIKAKKYSPLKMESQNVQKSSVNGNEDILIELMISEEESIERSIETNTKKDVGLMKEETDLSHGYKTSRQNSNAGSTKHEILKSKIENLELGDDDFLFDAFDEPFKVENEVDKTSKESGCNSESYCTTLTDDFDDVFSDDWNGDSQVEVDLNKLQRCKVLDITRDKFHNLIVNVIHVESQIPVSVTFMGFWREARLEVGDFVNIQATKQSDTWIVDNSNGFVVEQPDFLVSGTSVVGALFCTRRGVLSDRFKGIETVNDCQQGSSVMVIGNLVHELLQEVLKKQIYTKPGIVKVLKNLLNSQNTASMLYSASMSMETCEKEMSPFVTKIFHFIERYVKGSEKGLTYLNDSITEVCILLDDLGKPSRATDENFSEKINTVHDIEENLWVPQLGIKGKVDVTVEVSGNPKPRIMPLELKTGRPSFSLEHRGQVILYTMMMAVTGQDVEAGLLLYLRENIMREIKVGHPERRDLILLRNNLAYYLTRKPEIPNPMDSDSDLKTKLITMELPEPINHRACQNCPYSALCATYLKNENYKLSDRHPLSPIIKNLDNYLKPVHIEYVIKWVKMLQIDEVDQINKVQPMKFIWTVPPLEREKKGKCISNLKIIDQVIEKSGRYSHTLARTGSNDCELINDFTKSGFCIMDYIIVSTNTRVNVCAGPIIGISKNSITLLLERNLGKKDPNQIFHIDGYTSQSLLIMNLSNIGYLLDDNTITERMRKIVIEREPATFLNKLDRSVALVAAKILKPLNKTQQRAVLKVLAAKDYLLIKGMPGSGKTITLVAIIQMLSKMGKSVLLTAHTHSAVDNVLLKLIKTDVDFVRLGSSSKIHPLLDSKSESVLTQHCLTPESLDAAYNSKNVVCVTCLGANHSLLARRMFDVCLVDESTQVLQSSVLRPLYSASKFVLIGDPDQLPPVVKSNAARELGMDESLFERLDSDNNTVILTSQYRMNKRIMSIANQVTYKGQLIIGTDEIGIATLNIPDKSVLDSSEQWVRVALSTDLNDSVVVLDTGDKFNVITDKNMDSENADYHTERRCSNLCEAAVILHLTNTLIKAGVVAENIGVIAPYREQVNLLRDIIEHDIEVNTVDQYQGRDKEIILYSGTKSGSLRASVEKEFQILDDHRRLTVAITRAKHKLIMIADVQTLKQYIPFQKLFSVVESKDITVLRDGCEDFLWKELLSVVKHT